MVTFKFIGGKTGALLDQFDIIKDNLAKEENIIMSFGPDSTSTTPVIKFTNTQFGVASARIGLTIDSLVELTQRSDLTYWSGTLSKALTTPYYVEFTDIRGNKYSNLFGAMLTDNKWSKSNGVTSDTLNVQDAIAANIISSRGFLVKVFSFSIFLLIILCN